MWIEIWGLDATLPIVTAYPFEFYILSLMDFELFFNAFWSV
jgi:hypothetical protein